MRLYCSKLLWLDAWDQTLRSVTVDNLQVTSEFDFRKSLGACVLFGLAMTSHDTGYVSTWHEGDVIEFNVTSSRVRQVRSTTFSSDVIFSLAYLTHEPGTYVFTAEHCVTHLAWNVTPS